MHHLKSQGWVRYDDEVGRLKTELRYTAPRLIQIKKLHTCTDNSDAEKTTACGSSSPLIKVNLRGRGADGSTPVPTRLDLGKSPRARSRLRKTNLTDGNQR